MSVRILFFGATADIVGSREKHVKLDRPMCSGEILEAVKADHPGLSNRKLLLSLNEEFAVGTEALSDGDELAIFTPVSGG